MENQIEYQDHAVICETITVEKPKGKNTFHALYKLKRKRHRLAKPRDFKYHSIQNSIGFKGSKFKIYFT